MQNAGHDVLKEGQIYGMLRWKNVHMDNPTAFDTLVFADSFDPLIEAGWEVAQFKSGSIDELEPGPETRSGKKRKIELSRGV
ncbi:hypothetical protein Dda_8633 [Drechslerella dactyloides]|uniref:Uncharacterized protein n=1 Tax=Drechslerella dactyloides TaxID=74499 RepID=A0AAD6NEX5_DREDA|nr:hypothetical protein Dda_8633 [Drechslerella dactyloides]